MERLTERNSIGIWILKQPWECERCGEWHWCLPDSGYGSPTDRLAEYEDLGITPDHIKELDKQYTEKCSQIKEIVKRLEKEAEAARAGGNPEISGAYIRAIYIIKEIAEGRPVLTDDKLIDLVIKKAEQKFEIESEGK